jgi:hypothetical protein
MSDTPRTDAINEAGYMDTRSNWWVPVEFARQLERECNELRKQRDANAHLYFQVKQVEIPELLRINESLITALEDCEFHADNGEILSVSNRARNAIDASIRSTIDMVK